MYLCHALLALICRKSRLLKLDEFSEDIQEVLKLRSGRVSLECCKRYATITKTLLD